MSGPRRVRFTSRAIVAIALGTALLGATVAAGCGGDDDDGSPTAGAGDGGTLTMYSGRTPEFINPAIDEYRETTGSDIQVRFGDSAPLAGTLIEEGENSPADVYFSQDAGALGALEAEGLLAELPDSILEQVPPEFRSENDRWVGISGRARVIAYGEGVDPDELPDSPLELAEPQWEGRVGWAPGNASLHAYVTALRVVEGREVAREWLEGMVANGAQEYESNTTVRDAIASGEVDVGLINHYYVAQAVAEDPDYPVGVHFPPEGLGSLINVAGIGVLASSDQQEQAFELIEAMLGAAAQEHFVTTTKEYPLAAGVDPDPELVPLARIPAPEIDLSSIDDLEGTLEMMRETGAL